MYSTVWTSSRNRTRVPICSSTGYLDLQPWAATHRARERRRVQHGDCECKDRRGMSCFQKGMSAGSGEENGLCVCVWAVCEGYACLQLCVSCASIALPFEMHWLAMRKCLTVYT